MVLPKTLSIIKADDDCLAPRDIAFKLLYEKVQLSNCIYD
jgi:hypothetical protein